MKLSYRGLNYNDDPPTIDMMEEAGGLYRGCPWQIRYPRHVPVAQPSHSLKYRGVPYLSHTKTESQVADSTPANAPTAVTSIKKTGGVSNRKLEKAMMMQEVEKIHQANICRNLERRMNIAQAKGDRKLMNLLQQECQDLACALF